MGEKEEEIVVAEPESKLDHLVDPLNSGFKWYIHGKTAATSSDRWIISGDDMQILTLSVPPQGSVSAEMGSFMFMHPNMSSSVECCDGGCSRWCGGESCCKLVMKNDSNTTDTYVGITPNYPAKIIPIKFGTDVKSGTVIAKSGAYLSEMGDVEIGCDCDCGLTRCCCAGLGACRQKIVSTNGTAFIAAGGTILVKDLAAGEEIIIDQGSIVAMESTVHLGVSCAGQCCMCCFGGEGCLNASLTGPGRVWLQSISFQKYAAAVQTTVMEERGEEGDGQQ